MAKVAARFVCQDCGAATARWMGKCEACGAWNSIVEEAPREAAPKGLGSAKGRRIELVALEGASAPPPRRAVTGIAELDRVCGGGLVPASALLVGGDPGIGKSTLLLQAVAALAAPAAQTALYISGEEAIEQVRLRAAAPGLVGCASAAGCRHVAARYRRHARRGRARPPWW